MVAYKRGRLEEEDDMSERDRSPSSGEPEKPQTVRERKRKALYPPIASICSALGGFEEFRNEQGEIVSAYALGDQVIGCLKDLKRFWRMDDKDEDRTVARVFHEVGVLKNDLIPILHQTINTSARGDRIALAAVELMTAMTWPIDVAEELRDAKTHDELKASMDFNSLIEAQQSYKAAILHAGSLRPMFQLLSKALEKNRRDRTEKDENVISLILHMFRNLAAIKDRSSNSLSEAATEMAYLQSELVVQLAYENIFAFLIAIAHDSDSSEFSPWNMVVLDILHLIFRGVTPKELNTPANSIDQSRLQDLLETEDRSKRAAQRKSTTRHSRFGTTVALKTQGQQYIIHRQSSLAKGAEKSLDAAKKSKAKKFRQDDDLAPPSHLRPEAIAVLQQVAVSFIEAAFNPFFASVSKDIRMERPKVQPSDNLRFMFLARFFLEFFLLLRAEEHARGIDGASEHGHDFDLVTEMAEPLEIAFVTRRMKIALEDKPPNWKELHAAVECFVQILLLIDAMGASGVEEYSDLAEILQNKLYYEAEQLDMVLTVISQYKNQSYAYLNSIVQLAYVLLRMLEKYSKSKAYMYVRKKRQRAKKKKSKHGKEEAGDGLGMGDSDGEPDRDAVSHKEHAFEFETFEAKFAQENVLQTCMTYLESYRSFKSTDQLKRIVALMHRLAVRAKSEALFFKPTVFDLFQKIIDDEAYFVSHRTDQAIQDLRKVIEYILKRFFKAVQENPALTLESFFPKTRGQIGKMRLGADDPYATSEDETVVRARNAEYEVAEGFTHTQQIGIAIGALVDEGNLAVVEHIRNQIAIASEARKEIVLSIDGAPQDGDDEPVPPAEDADLPMRDEDGNEIADPAMVDKDSDEALKREATQLRKGPSSAAVSAFSAHHLAYDSDEQKEAILANGRAKLLLRLLNWDNESPDAGDFLPADHPGATEADIEAAARAEKNKTVWLIPITQYPAQLDADVQMINDFLADPIDPSNGKTAADLLRKKRKAPVRRKRRRLATDDEDGDADAAGSGDGDAGAGGGKRKKGGQRKRKNVLSDTEDEDGEEREKTARKRTKKAQKEQVIYKSAQFINDSDDESDAERDAAFFAAEAALRNALSTGAVAMTAPSGTRQSAAAATTKKKGKQPEPKRKIGKTVVVPQERDKTRTNVDLVSDVSDGDDDGSSSVASGPASRPAPPAAATPHSANESSDEENEPVRTQKKKRVVVDDEDSD